MRLLSTKMLPSGNFEIREVPDFDMAKYKYAILSHTWGQGEVSLQDMAGDGALGKAKEEYKKIKNFCAFAAEKGFDWVWMDTCCIDKTTSVELSEALNSMYRWYEEAEVCYAYLGDISTVSELEDTTSCYCKWFTRAWTLQELIAPKEFQFLNKSWEELGSRTELQDVVVERTGIPAELFSGKKELDSFSIAQKMSWAANREATRIEDRAYSLMGLFGVHMSMIYREREAAFIRLQKEILQISDDHSLFAWSSSDRRGGLLAMSPSAFAQSANIIPCSPHSSRASPPSLSGRGLNLEVRFKGAGPGGVGLAILPCKREGDKNTQIAIYVRDILMTMAQFERVWSGVFEEIDLTEVRPSHSQMKRICVRAGVRTSHGTQVAEKWDETPKKDDLFTKEDFLSYASDEHAAVRLARAGDIDRLWLALTSSHVELESIYGENNRLTALAVAAETAREDIFKLLLETGASIERDSNLHPRTWEYTPLSLAAKSGNEAIVSMLLERDAKVDGYFYEGNRPLFYAITGGNEAIVRSLIQSGAKVDRVDRDVLAPLSVAISHEDEAVIKLLIEEGAAVDVRDNNDRTALHWAAEVGNEIIVTLLLEKNAPLDYQDRGGLTPLISAAQNGHEKIVKLLLQKIPGFEAPWGTVYVVDAVDRDRRTALHWVAEMGNEAITNLLMGKNASLNCEDQEGRTPLILAARNGHENVLRLLLHNTTDLEARAKQLSGALIWATYKENATCVRFLLDAGAKPHAGWSDKWLHQLVKRGCEADVKLELDQGTPTEVKDDFGRTLLLSAAEDGNLEMAKVLLEKGALIEARDRFDRTPLLLAARGGNLNMVELLLDKGAKIGVEDCLHATPLHWAIENGSEAIVEKLLYSEANDDLKRHHRVTGRKRVFGHKLTASGDDLFMKTTIVARLGGHEQTLRMRSWRGEKVFDRDPLSLAKWRGHKEIVKLLEAYRYGQ